MNEFDIIAQYFQPLTEGKVALDNDAAALQVPAGMELVVSSDTLNEGVHFLDDIPADTLARKALRVNVSDLHAMGAEPLAYQLCIAFPDKPPEAWLEEFTGALLDDQHRAGIYCCGGDTTSTKGPLSITITAMGSIPEGGTITRSGALPGDVLVTTGAIGLAHWAIRKENGVLPPLRTGLQKILRDYVHAAIDVSDGLLADAGHIARSSGLGLDIHSDIAPEFLAGGDDYELALAVSKPKLQALCDALISQGLSPWVMGAFTDAHKDVKLFNLAGEQIEIPSAGWQHF